MNIVRYIGHADPLLLEGGNPADLVKGQLYEVSDSYKNGACNLFKLDGIDGFFPESYFTRIGGESYDKPKTRTWIRKTELVTSEDWILLMTQYSFPKGLRGFALIGEASFVIIFKKHPHVKSYRVGTFGEGEMGVTIVELK